MTKHTYPRFSARENNRNLMKLLVTSQSFQEEIEVFRKLFKVPKHNTPEDEYFKWLSHICNDIEQDEQSGTYIPRYVVALNNIVRGYNLPEHFLNHVREYIETGNISYPLNNFGVTPSLSDSEGPHPKMYANLSKKEDDDFLKEFSRFKGKLPTIVSVRNLDEMLESEKFYKECEEYNKSDDKEYNLTLKERLSGGKTKVKKVYEDKRMLADHRKKQFGKI